MYHLGEIVELKTKGMFYTTLGMVVNTSPLQMRLRCGAFIKTDNMEILKLREDLQSLYEDEFE